MNEPDMARDYQERGVQAVYSVLIELGQVLGAWRADAIGVGLGGSKPCLI